MAELTPERIAQLDRIVQDMLEDNHIEIDSQQSIDLDMSVPLQGEVAVDTSNGLAFVMVRTDHGQPPKAVVIMNAIQAIETGYILRELAKHMPELPDLPSSGSVDYPIEIRVVPVEKK
ncbi:hypothetical protein [Candidatus Palauibacter sp.]|uniref:hypothetical protein n=1 Tax=Candidatus Palauibacter sp. TaxID=3101350 RepID=UPI003B5CBE0D